ncbi:MAG: c-type cytochrome [Pyrinomonadaceae bacterium]
MNKIKVLILIVFATGAGVFVLMPGTTTTAAAVEDMSSPRSLYTKNCAGCHGAKGKAETRLGRKYKADDISGGVGTGKTIRIVTSGKGHMPSFKKRLSSAQIAQIAEYVKSL